MYCYLLIHAKVAGLMSTCPTVVTTVRRLFILQKTAILCIFHPASLLIMHFFTSIKSYVVYSSFAFQLFSYSAGALPSLITCIGENETIPINYAALGDSYATGIDAGKQLRSSCWRFKDSYPMQLIRTGLLGQNHSFQFLACSGAVLGIPGTSFSKQKSISRQIKALKPTDLATLSIGGNDVGFFNILNACVYRFYGIRSGNCNEQLTKSKRLISSDKFADAYTKTLTNILAKGTGPHFRLLALGYSPFFDEALSEDCTKRSFGYWRMWRPKLTVKLRRQLNEIPLYLNNRIVQLIKVMGDERIVWVDWAPKFKDHLFCQPGKKRPSDGDNTWFFDIDSRSKNLSVDDVDVDACAQHSLDSGDWGHRAACGIVMVREQYWKYPQILRRGSDNEEDEHKDEEDDNFSVDYFPNKRGLARVFHPKPQGYMAIAEVIQSHWPGMPCERNVAEQRDSN
ncbi:esterase [Blastomyces dermatitidis ATCC 18188]|uniref:Esterase n=1 Tax=Ajellomyces dermatitidis (strain ATCC 18188 / CBS 674.68) TaxID=653446 RepID=F2T8C5_AJEDA|nr:esterase [Blastomyces dermatitidis ATCC 18188]